MTRTKWMGLTLAITACSSDLAVPTPPDAPASRPSWCGPALESKPPPRPSSLRRGSCDFGESPDFISYDLQCASGPCAEPQTGDQLCHRVCDDGLCAEGETCESRIIYVSDTPARSAKLCMCTGGVCQENPSATSPTGGGLAAWRDEAAMPVDLYDHAMAAGAGQLFISGGLKVKERMPTSAILELQDTIYVADLDAIGTVSGWREAGKLPHATRQHAMAVVNGRLYVAGGEVNSTNGASAFSDAVVSYAISSNGSVGTPRDEVRLPHARGWHVLLVDPGENAARNPRLVVASGALDSNYFTDGTAELTFADVATADGTVGTWSTIEAPAPLFFDGAAVLAAGALYGFVAGEYFDRSSRALYGIRLADLKPSTQSASFTRSKAWPYDPTALSAVNEQVRLASACGMLVRLGEGGTVATAPVDAAAHVGAFHAAARFFGGVSGTAVAASPSGRIYQSGGTGSEVDGTSVRSTTSEGSSP